MTSISSAAIAWLAAADPDAEHARRWISSAKIILLPLGTAWDAVRTTERAGLAAAPEVPGPIIHDPGHAVYFIVRLCLGWDRPGTELLSNGTWLAVPTPRTVEPPGPYWLRPPDDDGPLADVDTLHAALGQCFPMMSTRRLEAAS